MNHVLEPLNCDNFADVDSVTPSVPPPARKNLLFRVLGRLLRLADWIFGFLSLIVGLALLSVIPFLNFLSLGYLLHVSGTVATTGRLRDGFIGVRKASILGSFVAGTWLVSWPLRIVSQMWKDAELIAPGSPTAQHWRLGLIVLTVLTLGHIAWASWRGGRLQHFLWPAPLRFWHWFWGPKHTQQTCAAAIAYLGSLRLAFLFWLGLRGFIGAAAWLVVPVGLLLLASHLKPVGAGLLSLLGGLLLLLAVLYVPFLQTQFARTRRLRSLFDLRSVRSLFQRAPVAFWLALLSTLLLALPLYLLKIELTPRELAWLPSLVFVAFIFPARLITGWAMSRALRREQPRHGFLRWSSRLMILPVALIYVLFVYFTQYLSWNGALSLLEQHAFLVPAPLMAL